MESSSTLQTLYALLQLGYTLKNSRTCVRYCIWSSQNPPCRCTGLCWAYSMPPCQYKASVFSPACAPALLFSIRCFPDALPCKLAFHLVGPDTLTKEINKRVSKSRQWIFSDLSVYPLLLGGLSYEFPLGHKWSNVAVWLCSQWLAGSHTSPGELTHAEGLD